MIDKEMGVHGVVYKGIKYLADFQVRPMLNKRLDGPDRRQKPIWIMDVMSYPAADPNSDKIEGFVAADKSEAVCLKCAPKMISQLCKWGLPVKKACDLVAEAIGHKAEVKTMRDFCKGRDR